jgi:predicted membrane protein
MPCTIAVLRIATLLIFTSYIFIFLYILLHGKERKKRTKKEVDTDKEEKKYSFLKTDILFFQNTSILF